MNSSVPLASPVNKSTNLPVSLPIYSTVNQSPRHHVHLILVMTVKRNITLTTGSGSSIFPDAGTFLSFAAVSRTRSTVSTLFYVYRFQGKLPVSSTMSTFIDLRRHRPHRQLSSSPPLRHSFSSVPHDATYRHAANPSSIVFDTSAVGSLYATFAIDFASRRQTVFSSPA